MFQLIVAVISIALVAALAIASIYYGGAAFTSSSLRANVTTLVNAGQQISGAVALYKADNSATPTMAQLKADGEYLSAEPGKAPFATGDWLISTNGQYAAVAITGNAEICDEAERQAGGATGQFACASDAEGAAVTTGNATHFVFKL